MADEPREVPSESFASYRAERPGPLNRLVIWSYRVGFVPTRFLVKLFLNIQLPRKVPFIRMGHPFNIVVNDGAIFGRNCTLFHHVTLAGQRFGARAGAPRLGDDVIVFPNSVIVGKVTIGDRSVIGAGSVVVSNIPPDSVAAGNPARVIAHITKGLSSES